MYQETIHAHDASAVEVSITCDNCGQQFTIDPIGVPDGNDMSDSIEDSRAWGDSDSWICPTPDCGKEYTISVSNNSGGDIDIDIEELEHNAQVSIRPIFNRHERDFEDEDDN
jgi:hypothetical protein